MKLSSDSLPKNLGINPIAFVPEWTDPRQYGKFSEQTSAPVYLEAGNKYYVEAMFKEGAGGDNLSVAWKLPNGNTETPIPSSRLAFYTKNPPVSVNEINKNANDLLIYPLPAQDFIWVKTSSIDGLCELSVTDILGNAVKAERLNISRNQALKIDVADLKSGVYFLTVRNRKQSSNSKFLINR